MMNLTINIPALPGEEAQQLLGEQNVVQLLVHIGSNFSHEAEIAEMICTSLGE